MAEVTGESDQNPQVVALRPDAGADGLAEADRKNAPGSSTRPWWERALQIVGGTAGAGVLILIMGALVIWVRLASAGLPTEQGLSATPRADLLVAGAHVMIVPLLAVAVLVVAVAYVSKFQQPEEEDDASIEAAVRKTLARWTAAHGHARALSVVLGPVLLVAKPIDWLSSRLAASNLARVGVFVVLFLIAPLAVFDDVLIGSCMALLVWALHVARVRNEMGWSERGVFSRLLAGLAVVVMASSLASQVGKPSQYPPASVALRSGQTIQGLLVSRNAQVVYIGVGHTLKEISDASVVTVSVGHARSQSSRPPSPVVRLFNLIF